MTEKLEIEEVKKQLIGYAHYIGVKYDGKGMPEVLGISTDYTSEDFPYNDSEKIFRVLIPTKNLVMH